MCENSTRVLIESALQIIRRRRFNVYYASHRVTLAHVFTINSKYWSNLKQFTWDCTRLREMFFDLLFILLHFHHSIIICCSELVMLSLCECKYCYYFTNKCNLIVTFLSFTRTSTKLNKYIVVSTKHHTTIR